MKCFVRLLLLLMVAVLFAQCGRFSYHPKLVQLDSLADINADSAVSLMHQIEPLMAEADERDRRYFKLLSIKVADKADLLLPTDTAAWQLVDWYEQHGDSRLLPMAYYYAARVCRTRNDSPQALDYLLKAHDLLRDDDSQLHLKAVVNSQMGYIFSQQKLYQYALAAFRNSYRYDSLLRDTTGMILNLRDLGFNYENVGERDSSICYFEQAMSLAELQNEKLIVMQMKVQMANVYLKIGKINETHELISAAMNCNDKANQSATYSIAAKTYQALGLMDSASFCYNRLSSLPSVYAKKVGYKGLSDYLVSKGNIKEAFRNFCLYQQYSDSVDKITATTTVAQMHSLYNYQLRERENQALRKANEIKSRMIYTVVIVITLLILLCIIAYSYIRHKDLELKVKLERRQRVKVAMELADIREKDKSQQEIILRDSNVVKSIMRVLNDPNDVNKVLSEEIWDELEKGVLDICPSFKTQITDICKLSDFKYHVCLLLKANISIANIALLTQHSTEAVTSTRRRMAKKAFGPESTPQDWDHFIAAI
jgi:tetratricopeptide (TPR) repeat protein